MRWSPEFYAILKKRRDHMKRNTTEMDFNRVLDTRENFTADVCGCTRYPATIRIVELEKDYL